MNITTETQRTLKGARVISLPTLVFKFVLKFYSVHSGRKKKKERKKRKQKGAFKSCSVSAELLEREYLVPFLQIFRALLKEIPALIASISRHEMPKSMLLFASLPFCNDSEVLIQADCHGNKWWRYQAQACSALTSLCRSPA